MPGAAMAGADGRRALRRFVLSWALGTAFLVGSVGAFNAAVDPYLVVGAPRIAGFNARKPETETHGRIEKDHLIGRVRPSGLVIGDSKADVGLDPESPWWPAEARPVFDDALPAISLEAEVARLRRDLGKGGVRRVMLVLDLQGLLAPPLPGLAADPPPAADPVVPLVGPAASDAILSTLSLDALLASVRTVASQRDPDAVDVSDWGATGDGGFRASVAAEGEAAVFAEKDAQLDARLARLAAYLGEHAGAPEARIPLVVEALAACRSAGALLDVVVPPYHADYLDLVSRHGLWDAFEAAKSRLGRALLGDGRGGVRLWDFERYDRFSTERVPVARGGATRWFWEPSHFKRGLGELLLRSVYGGGSGFGSQVAPPGAVSPGTAGDAADRPGPRPSPVRPAP